ncbi:MAG: hypothetical protein ACTSPV_01290 [Candidatus Hodarchaeales archaeon]
MEEQEILNLETGTKETQQLKPANVKIVKIRIENIDVKGKSNQKAVFEVKHPDKEETIEISSVGYRRGRELKVAGLWISLDEDNKLRKGSALAILKDFYNCRTLSEMVGMEIPTLEDEKGYLCFKAV